MNPCAKFGSDQPSCLADYTHARFIRITPNIQVAAKKSVPNKNCNFSETADYFNTKFSTIICKGYALKVKIL